MRQAKRITTSALKGVVRAYQLLVSPVMAGNCRFHPTCSSYALEALEVHGPLAGIWLAIKRIGRCHPWGGAGLDEVPAVDEPTPLNTLHKC